MVSLGFFYGVLHVLPMIDAYEFSVCDLSFYELRTPILAVEMYDAGWPG